MQIVSGVDLVEIDRLRDKSANFMQRVFTPQERERAHSAETLAGIWAVKESVAKALGTGLGPVRFLEIEVLKDEKDKPILMLHGSAETLAAEQNLTGWSISISHTKTHAVAHAIAIKMDAAS